MSYEGRQDTLLCLRKTFFGRLVWFGRLVYCMDEELHRIKGKRAQTRGGGGGFSKDTIDVK